jgi:PBSX family phage terminase large subunit
MSYRLTERQTIAYDLALSGDKRVIVFGGAIRGGKTYWLLLTLTSLCLAYPRSRWAIIRKSLPDLKRTTFPSFSSIMVDGVSNYVRSWNRDTQVVTFINGSELIFMAESYDEDKDLNRFRGLEINGAGLDEVNELQEPTFYKVQERIGSWNKAQGKPPILCLATCNPAQNWVKTVIYKRYVENTLPERWAFIPSKITDNPHIPIEYLEALKELPPIQYARFVEGDWDVMDEVLNPFLYEWLDEKHIDDNATLNPNIPVYVSVDFNINPLCALVIQQTSGGANVVDEIRIDKGSIEAFCDAVRALNIPIGLLRITGDAMGRGGTVQQRDNSSAYTMIKRLLHMNDSQFIIPANPKHENSRVDCNSALRRLDIRVNSKRCKGFVFDAKQVQCDANGSIIKLNRRKLTERADYLDCFRYFVNAILKRYL